MSDEGTEDKRAAGEGEPSRDAPAAGDTPGVAEASTPRGGSLSIRWIALGAIIITAGIALADKVVVAHVVRSSEIEGDSANSDFAVIKAAIDKGAAEMTPEEKAELRSAVAGQWPIVAAFAVALLLVPIAIGVVIGRRTSSILSAAIAVCAGAIIGFAVEGVEPLAVAIGAVVYLGIGALTGLLGKRLAARRQAAAENP